jgi:hypothetical protein
MCASIQKRDGSQFVVKSQARPENSQREREREIDLRVVVVALIMA